MPRRRRGHAGALPGRSRGRKPPEKFSAPGRAGAGRRFLQMLCAVPPPVRKRRAVSSCWRRWETARRRGTDAVPDTSLSWSEGQEMPRRRRSGPPQGRLPTGQGRETPCRQKDAPPQGTPCGGQSAGTVQTAPFRARKALCGRGGHGSGRGRCGLRWGGFRLVAGGDAAGQRGQLRPQGGGLQQLGRVPKAEQPAQRVILIREPGAQQQPAVPLLQLEMCIRDRSSVTKASLASVSVRTVGTVVSKMLRTEAPALPRALMPSMVTTPR